MTIEMHWRDARGGMHEFCVFKLSILSFRFIHFQSLSEYVTEGECLRVGGKVFRIKIYVNL